MLTVGIIGANGHVGTEVSLLLSVDPDTRVVAVCRSEVSAGLLRRCGIECRIGSVTNSAQAPSLLHGCDVVINSALPDGLPKAVRTATSAILRGAVEGSPPGAILIEMSSIMALGMGSSRDAFRHHLFARTKYGATKRHGERVARQLGRKTRHPVYVLRLGQVHGHLQTASRGMLRSARKGEIVHVPAVPSYAVFCETIVEAIRRIATRTVPQGTYTLVEPPHWTWVEVHRHFARLAGASDSQVVPISASTWEGDGHSFSPRAAMRRALSGPFGFAVRHREVLDAYVLSRVSESLAQRVQAKYYERGARSEIAQQAAPTNVPAYFKGDVPGRMPGLLGKQLGGPNEADAGVEALLRRAEPRRIVTA